MEDTMMLTQPYAPETDVMATQAYAPAALQQRLTQALECLIGEASEN